MRKFLDWLYWDAFRWFFIIISCALPAAIVLGKTILAIVLGIVCVLYYLFIKWYVKNIWKKGLTKALHNVIIHLEKMKGE